MKQANEIISPKDMNGRHCSDTVTLDRQGRFRRRITLTTDQGYKFLLNLPKAAYLEPGAGLLLGNGTIVLVKAADEDLLHIQARDPLVQMRIAWHLGNRHTPAEITPDGIYIQNDNVLAELLIALGAEVVRVSRQFEPEGGAYGGHGELNPPHSHGHTSDVIESLDHHHHD